MRKLAVSLYFTLATLPAVAVPNYTLTVLGDADGTQAWAMNNRGIGVGENFRTDETLMFSRGGISVLPMPASAQHTPHAINDANTIVGTTRPDAGYARAFVLQDGVYRDIGGRQGTYSHAWDVNNTGTVLVNYLDIQPDGGREGAYIMKADGSMVDLGALDPGGDTFGVGINDRGQVTGMVRWAAGGYAVPFIWENGTMTSFGGLGSTFGGVNGISELGHVFGTSADLFSSHAWVIRDGSAESYSDLARILYIDTAGRIYGLDQQWQAAIVEGGTITRVGDLIDGASGWTFWMDAANERGDILTSACYAGNCDYTVMLTAVPEPSTYAMLLLGGLALYGHARRRRA